MTTNPQSLTRTRRSLYEALLQLEQQKVVIVERALPYGDMALSPSTCVCIWTEKMILQASITAELKLSLHIITAYTSPIRSNKHCLCKCACLLSGVGVGGWVILMQSNQVDCLLLNLKWLLLCMGCRPVNVIELQHRFGSDKPSIPGYCMVASTLAQNKATLPMPALYDTPCSE